MNTRLKMQFVKGKKYEMPDIHGMIVKRGIYRGTIENKFLGVLALLFERDDGTYMGGILHHRLGRDGKISLIVMAKYYGDTPETLNWGAYHANEWKMVS